MQGDLFQKQSPDASTSASCAAATPPLAHRMRPTSLDHFYGQKEVFYRYPFLKRRGPQRPLLPSIILSGPCGCGKTTLARLLAEHHQLELYPFRAVLEGVGELKKLIAKAQEIQKIQRGEERRNFVIFIDEIHRFNKAQQDALLPYVERGDFILIGATTENPRTNINRALLSRLQIVLLQALDETAIHSILERAMEQLPSPCRLRPEIVELLTNYCAGDARKALNALELLADHFHQHSCPPTPQQALNLIQENSRYYDRDSDRHYDVISAFIKSMRGSDPDAALLWLAVMLDGGEDPLFIARRLAIFASEDVGNADSNALALATHALLAVEKIGMPEARIILAHATTYLAATVKSNASYLAIEQALDYVKKHPNLPVPNHLRNHHPEKKNYRYPHNFPDHWVHQNYLPDDACQFKCYSPTEQGQEKLLKRHLDHLKHPGDSGSVHLQVD